MGFGVRGLGLVWRGGSCGDGGIKGGIKGFESGGESGEREGELVLGG